jgi:DNA-binding CsgD family transcriptional regulator
MRHTAWRVQDGSFAAAPKMIAAQLSITEETVKGHVKNILAKLAANDRRHAVTIGLKRGIDL